MAPAGSSRPSGLNATEETAPVWPVSMCSWALVAGSHSHTVLSPFPLGSSRPSGLNATEKMPLSVIRDFVFGVMVRMFSCAPVAGSHSRTVLSKLPLASSRPSGLNATEEMSFSRGIVFGNMVRSVIAGDRGSRRAAPGLLPEVELVLAAG
jgi:hypothetical protein